MKFTQYISPWVNGQATKIIIDREESATWATLVETIPSGRHPAPDKRIVSAAELAAIEASCVALNMSREDHN